MLSLTRSGQVTKSRAPARLFYADIFVFSLVDRIQQQETTQQDSYP
jgi:hypothetical protein